MRRAALLALATLAYGAAEASAAPDGALASEVRRGFLAAGPSSSDVPAMRVESAARPPSAGFALGAALGGWLNAAETLDFDLKTPSGDGDDTETIRKDCYEEAAMLERLETRRKTAGLTPAETLRAAGADAGGLPGWTRRLAAPVAGCGQAR